MRETVAESSICSVLRQVNSAFSLTGMDFQLLWAIFLQFCRIPHVTSLAGFFPCSSLYLVHIVISKSLGLFVCFPMDIRLSRITWPEIPGSGISANQAPPLLFILLHLLELDLNGNTEVIRIHNLSLCIDHHNDWLESECSSNCHMLRVWHWHDADTKRRAQGEPDQFSPRNHIISILGPPRC